MYGATSMNKSMNTFKTLGKLDFSTTGSVTSAEGWCQWKQTMQQFIELIKKMQC